MNFYTHSQLGVTMSCRDDLAPKCRLGMLGCRNVQISGNSALNVKRSQDADEKDTVDLPPLGPGQFDVMVIGDHPSFGDDRRDMIFQDPPSKFVISSLEKAGHDLSRVWMTKLVKCAPPKKRIPAMGELKTCRETYLRKEIELVQPKVVILVGAPALKAFNLTGQGSINTIRGRLFEEKFAGWDDGPTFKIIPTLNPASFFYKPNEKLRSRVTYDYVVAKQVADGLPITEHYKHDYDLIDSVDKLDALEAELKKAPMIAFDTEACSLNYRKCPLISIQISWDWDKVAIIPINQHDPEAPKEQEFHLNKAFGELHPKRIKKFLKRVFENPDTVKVAHNLKFDLNVLRWYYGIKAKGFLLDTLIQKHLMHELPPSNLEYCTDLEFAWGDYAAKRRAVTGSGRKLKATFDKVPDKILWEYGALDALGTYRLACVYTERMKKNHPNLWQFYVDESEPLIRCLAKTEYKGALADIEVMDALEKEWSEELNELLRQMRAITFDDFNPMSNPQLIKAFHNLGVSVELEDEASASGYTANKKKLQELLESHKDRKVQSLCENVMMFRNRRKMISTYMKNARKDMDTDGRLRYGFNQAGPVTGRLSCTFFHQIPKVDKERVNAGLPIMREMFVVPEGYQYVYGDYSQVELRILAIITGDEEMIKQLSTEDGDVHAATTYEFLKTVWPEYTEEMARADKFNRTEVGKRVNFGLAYGSEGFALVKTGKWKDWDGVERQFTWNMLDRGMKQWHARFPKVGHWIENCPEDVRMAGSVAKNVFGRERHFGGELNLVDDYKRGKAERECINFFIQSAAASITNRTIIAIDKILEEKGILDDEICMVNTVHDSIAYEVADHLVDWFRQVVEAVSNRVIKELSNSFKIDLGSGPNWALAEINAG